MKPIIIFKEKNSGGKFEFTQKELEKLLQDAYDQGAFDYASSHPNIISATPSTVPQTTPLTPLDPYKLTPYSPFVCTSTSTCDPSIIAHNGGGQNESRNQ